MIWTPLCAQGQVSGHMGATTGILRADPANRDPRRGQQDRSDHDVATEPDCPDCQIVRYGWSHRSPWASVLIISAGTGRARRREREVFSAYRHTGARQ
jgi:hypothetical protein